MTGAKTGPVKGVQCLEVLSSSQKEGGKPEVEAGLHEHLTCIDSSRSWKKMML